MKPLSIKFPERDIEDIDEIVELSKEPRTKRRTTQKYDTRVDFIRVAVLKLIEMENREIERHKE